MVGERETCTWGQRCQPHHKPRQVFQAGGKVSATKAGAVPSAGVTIHATRCPGSMLGHIPTLVSLINGEARSRAMASPRPPPQGPLCPNNLLCYTGSGGCAQSQSAPECPLAAFVHVLYFSQSWLLLSSGHVAVQTEGPSALGQPEWAEQFTALSCKILLL